MKNIKFNILLILAVLLTACNSPAPTPAVKPLCNPAITAEFLRWDKMGGKPLKGLTKRRQQEAELFMRGCSR